MYSIFFPDYESWEKCFRRVYRDITCGWFAPLYMTRHPGGCPTHPEFKSSKNLAWFLSSAPRLLPATTQMLEALKMGGFAASHLLINSFSSAVQMVRDVWSQPYWFLKQFIGAISPKETCYLKGLIFKTSLKK